MKISGSDKTSNVLLHLLSFGDSFFWFPQLSTHTAFQFVVIVWKGIVSIVYNIKFYHDMNAQSVLSNVG